LAYQYHKGTTKLPLTQGFHVFQEDSIWYLENKEWNQQERKWEIFTQWPFRDGMTINADKSVNVVPGPSRDELIRLNKEILKYSRNYIKALFAGDVPKPGPSDCWYCLMRADKVISKEPLMVQGKMVAPSKETLGEATKNIDHLLSHFSEKYYVPSLLVRAIEVFPVSKAAQWALQDLWGVGLPEAGKFFYGVAKQQLRSSLCRYLRRQLGLAS